MSESASKSYSNVDAAISVSNTGTAGDYRFYALPAPMYLPPLPSISSPCTNSKQMGFSAGWSAFAYTDGATSTDNCVGIEMYNAAVKMCNYKTAAQIMDLLTVKVLAGYTAPDRSLLLDLTPRECQALSMPILKQSFVTIDDPIWVATAKKGEKDKTPPTQPEPKKEPKKTPKTPKVVSSATTDSQCAKDAILACKIK
jgi:hypothetical protein